MFVVLQFLKTFSMSDFSNVYLSRISFYVLKTDLKQKKWNKALDDCNTVLAMEPDNLKGQTIFSFRGSNLNCSLMCHIGIVIFLQTLWSLISNVILERLRLQLVVTNNLHHPSIAPWAQRPQVSNVPSLPHQVSFQTIRTGSGILGFHLCRCPSPYYILLPLSAQWISLQHGLNHFYLIALAVW